MILRQAKHILEGGTVVLDLDGTPRKWVILGKPNIQNDYVTLNFEGAPLAAKGGLTFFGDDHIEVALLG